MFVCIILEVAVIVDLVGRCVGIDGTLGERCLLLLSTDTGKVVGQDGSLAAVAVKDVVIRAVDVIVVVHSANVLDGLGKGLRKSTVGLLTGVDRRVCGDNRSSR